MKAFNMLMHFNLAVFFFCIFTYIYDVFAELQIFLQWKNTEQKI